MNINNSNKSNKISKGTIDKIVQFLKQFEQNVPGISYLLELSYELYVKHEDMHDTNKCGYVPMCAAASRELIVQLITISYKNIKDVRERLQKELEERFIKNDKFRPITNPELIDLIDDIDTLNNNMANKINGAINNIVKDSVLSDGGKLYKGKLKVFIRKYFGNLSQDQQIEYVNKIDSLRGKFCRYIHDDDNNNTLDILKWTEIGQFNTDYCNFINFLSEMIDKTSIKVPVPESDDLPI